MEEREIPLAAELDLFRDSFYFLHIFGWDWWSCYQFLVLRHSAEVKFLILQLWNHFLFVNSSFLSFHSRAIKSFVFGVGRRWEVYPFRRSILSWFPAKWFLWFRETFFLLSLNECRVNGENINYVVPHIKTLLWTMNEWKGVQARSRSLSRFNQLSFIRTQCFVGVWKKLLWMEGREKLRTLIWGWGWLQFV